MYLIQISKCFKASILSIYYLVNYRKSLKNMLGFNNNDYLLEGQEFSGTPILFLGSNVRGFDLKAIMVYRFYKTKFENHDFSRFQIFFYNLPKKFVSAPLYFFLQFFQTFQLTERRPFFRKKSNSQSNKYRIDDF